jgi:hypothetical protein
MREVESLVQDLDFNDSESYCDDFSLRTRGTVVRQYCVLAQVVVCTIQILNTSHLD